MFLRFSFAEPFSQLYPEAKGGCAMSLREPIATSHVTSGCLQPPALHQPPPTKAQSHIYCAIRIRDLLIY
jgi:hypothetical protein